MDISTLQELIARIRQSAWAKDDKSLENVASALEEIAMLLTAIDN